MSSSDSMLYTIGTALNRARDSQVSVQVLVGGAWVSGRVVAVDGHGVVLNGGDQEHSVVRIEAVQAVKIGSVAPIRTPLPAGAVPQQRRPYE